MLNKAGLDGEARKRVVALAKVAVEYFNSEDWQALGVHTGQLDVITRHDRLLRSLSFNDPDYAGNANAVLFRLVEIDRTNLDIIAEYIAENYGEEGESLSTRGGKGRAITFTPSVFEIPEGCIEKGLIAVMTPFA